MAKASAVKVEVPSVSLRSVVLVVPKNVEDKRQLVEDLTQMGCEELLLEPWSLKSEAMAQKFLLARSNEWEGTIQRYPERWTADSWAEVYSFRKEGRSMAGRTDKLVDGKFKMSINLKDGHAVADCVDPRARRVLEFVVPILYPEKPSRVMLTVGNTIFGALFKVRKVNWRQVLQEVIEKVVSALKKEKPSPISPYLFHLYHKNECLRGRKMEELEVAKKYLEYGVSPETIAQSDIVEIDSERESLTSAKHRKILGVSPRGSIIRGHLRRSHQSGIRTQKPC